MTPKELRGIGQSVWDITAKRRWIEDQVLLAADAWEEDIAKKNAVDLKLDCAHVDNTNLRNRLATAQAMIFALSEGSDGMTKEQRREWVRNAMYPK